MTNPLLERLRHHVTGAIEHGKITLYLSNGDKVTNWPGSLRIRAYRVKHGKHNIARTRTDAWFTFEGANWHGVNYGKDSQILHCRRTKMSDPIVVIPREEYNKFTCQWDVILFFPEQPANYGRIQFYGDGAHGEACIDYYRKTRKPKRWAALVVPALQRYFREPGDEYRQMERINYNKLRKAWVR